MTKVQAEVCLWKSVVHVMIRNNIQVRGRAGAHAHGEVPNRPEQLLCVRYQRRNLVARVPACRHAQTHCIGCWLLLACNWELPLCTLLSGKSGRTSSCMQASNSASHGTPASMLCASAGSLAHAFPGRTNVNGCRGEVVNPVQARVDGEKEHDRDLVGEDQGCLGDVEAVPREGRWCRGPAVVC